jgi:galactokinase
MNRPFMLSVPGRVSLIGEHIDYHNLPVLPIAIQKRITISFVPGPDRRIRATSDQAAHAVDFALGRRFTPGPQGHWGNYARAAADAIESRHSLANGMNAFLTSDLPMAAGLSSSSALLVAFSLALLRANQREMTLQELTALLPDSEQLVGTRGGAMDHIAILASRAGYATLINSFVPLDVDYIPVPRNWRFLVAHSLVSAEKSGAVRSEYNARSAAGARALKKLGFTSYRQAIANCDEHCVPRLDDESEQEAFLHVMTEARRVQRATAALRQAELGVFGRILCESHASLRDRLHVSLPQIDTLVESVLQAGAFGARLTGAGFGGCVVSLCTSENVEAVRTRLMESYYAHRPAFRANEHLFIAEPSAGVLGPEAPDHRNQD